MFEVCSYIGPKLWTSRAPAPLSGGPEQGVTLAGRALTLRDTNSEKRNPPSLWKIDSVKGFWV
jgi:hypothetical protein